MKRLLKFLLKALLVLGGLILIGFLARYGFQQYKKYSWSPPTEVHGVYIGMTRSDLLFMTTDKWECLDDSMGLDACPVFLTPFSYKAAMGVDDM